MRYIFYIAAIIVVFSGLAVYGLMDTRVEVSKPAVVINDRIITESELKDLMITKPYYMTREEFIDSVITQEILIQEAVRHKINQEEPFRKSVENFYEQSLIKVLLDRKLSSLEVAVTHGEIEKYRRLSQSRVKFTKIGYKSVNDAKAGRNGTPKEMASDFMDISEDLKFVLMNLERGGLSQPVESGMGVLVYRLNQVIPIESAQVRETDVNQVASFIRDKKREVLMEAWTRQLKENAEIWRDK